MSPHNTIVIGPRELGTIVIRPADRACYTTRGDYRIDLPATAVSRHLDANGDDITTITFIGAYVRWE